MSLKFSSPFFMKTNLKGRRRQWHPTPVLLPGKSHGWRNLVVCSPWGREESDTTERLHFSLSCIGEGNGNPLQSSCLENPRDGGAWWAAVYGVAQSRIRLKRLSSSSSNLKGKVSWGLGVVESDTVAESDQKHLWISVTYIRDRGRGSLKATRMWCASCPQRAVRDTAPCAPSPLTASPQVMEAVALGPPRGTTWGQV